jgi:hypothetical protein
MMPVDGLYGFDENGRTINPTSVANKQNLAKSWVGSAGLHIGALDMRNK